MSVKVMRTGVFDYDHVRLTAVVIVAILATLRCGGPNWVSLKDRQLISCLGKDITPQILSLNTLWIEGRRNR